MAFTRIQDLIDYYGLEDTDYLDKGRIIPSVRNTRFGSKLKSKNISMYLLCAVTVREVVIFNQIYGKRTIRTHCLEPLKSFRREHLLIMLKAQLKEYPSLLPYMLIMLSVIEDPSRVPIKACHFKNQLIEALGYKESVHKSTKLAWFLDEFEEELINAEYSDDILKNLILFCNNKNHAYHPFTLEENSPYLTHINILLNKLPGNKLKRLKFELSLEGVEV